MTKTPKKLLFFQALLIALISVGCKNNSPSPNPNIEGGPCTYQADSIPLKLIDTIRFPNGDLDLVFSLSHSHFNDTLNYTDIMQLYLTQQDTFNLSFDSTYLLIHQTIQSGSCNPQIDNIILNK